MKIQELLRDPECARDPAIWDFHAELAEARCADAFALTRRERALDLAFESLPASVDVPLMRGRCGAVLLGHAKLAGSSKTLDAAARARTLARIVETADRWRAIDHESPEACALAARALQDLGLYDLAWDYMLKPVGAHPDDAACWSALGAQIDANGHTDLALRAYEEAARLDPADPNHLLAQGEILDRAMRRAEANRCYERIVAGTWLPEFDDVKRRAAACLR